MIETFSEAAREEVVQLPLREDIEEGVVDQCYILSTGGCNHKEKLIPGKDDRDSRGMEDGFVNLAKVDDECASGRVRGR